MKKTTFKLLSLLFIATLSSCNTNNVDYKFTDSDKVLTCELANVKLYNEAIHSFENDLINNYDKQKKTTSRAYSQFVNAASRNSFKIEDIASAHSLKIAHALKNDATLWANTNGETTLDYSNALMKCISENIKEKRIKQTFNALLSTNSMRPKIVLPSLRNSARAMQSKPSLKAYLAFDFFYAKLLNVKLEDLKNPDPQPEPEAAPAPAPAKPAINNIDLNKVPKTTPKAPVDAHAGHNH